MSLQTEMAWPSMKIRSQRSWLAFSGEEQVTLRDMTFWFSERRSVRLSQVAAVMDPGGRLLSVSILARQSVSLGLKSLVQGTNLKMTLYPHVMIVAEVPRMEGRKNVCSSV